MNPPPVVAPEVEGEGSSNRMSAGCEQEGPNIFAFFLTAISVLLLATTLPFSLLTVVKVVQVRLAREGSQTSELLLCSRSTREPSSSGWAGC